MRERRREQRVQTLLQRRQGGAGAGRSMRCEVRVEGEVLGAKLKTAMGGVLVAAVKKGGLAGMLGLVAGDKIVGVGLKSSAPEQVRPNPPRLAPSSPFCQTSAHHDESNLRRISHQTLHFTSIPSPFPTVQGLGHHRSEGR